MEEIATCHVDIVEVMLLVTVPLVTAPVDVKTIGRVTGAKVRIQYFIIFVLIIWCFIFFFIFKHIYSIISMLCWFLFCFVHWMFILRTRNNKVDCLHRQPSEIMEDERFNCLWVIYYVRAFNMNRLHNWIVDIEFWTFSFTLHSYIFRS